jgi:hypothetical protein
VTVGGAPLNATIVRRHYGAIMNEHIVKQAITPLRLIFWGGLLCVFDFTFSETTNGWGLKFDVLDDVLGTILIAVGVFRLSASPVHDRYATMMKFVQVMSLLAVLDAIRDHFIMPLHPVVQFVLSLFGLITLAAIVGFCIAMRWFCEATNLLEASRSWSTTTLLFVIIYLVPLGLFYVITAGTIASGTSFDLNLGPAGLVCFPVFVIPFIHLFMSTSRMRRAAETMAVADFTTASTP